MITEKDIGKKVRVTEDVFSFLVGREGELLSIEPDGDFPYEIKLDDGVAHRVQQVELVDNFKEGALVEVISHDWPCDYFGRKGIYVGPGPNSLRKHLVEFASGQRVAVMRVKLLEQPFKKGDLVKIISYSGGKLPTQYAFFVEYSSSTSFPYRLRLVTSDLTTPFHEKATKIEKVATITPEEGKLYRVVAWGTIKKMRYTGRRVEAGYENYVFKSDEFTSSFGIPPMFVLEEVESLKPVTVESCFNCEVEFYDMPTDAHPYRGVFVGKIGSLFMESDNELSECHYQRSVSFLKGCSLWKYARRIPGIKYLDD